MRVLIDTNVMLDILMGRQPYFDIADYIVTRNVKDFTISRVPAVSPEIFLEKLEEWV